MTVGAFIERLKACCIDSPQHWKDLEMQMVDELPVVDVSVVLGIGVVFLSDREEEE